MILAILVYLTVLFFGGEQHKRKMIKARPFNSLGFDVQPFKQMLYEKYGIVTEEQLLRLDEIIKRELSLNEYYRKYPLSEMIKQLIVAILTTGLLSYAFIEIRYGNQESASNLIAVYLTCIAIIAMIGGFLKQCKDFGSTSSLNDISYMIQIVLLEESIQKEQPETTNKNNIEHDYLLPRRKLRYK
ncbi:hypothetical protein [Robertmurraya korlensis]|uniref:hypothetical protein n=1 Tax=Robertmurraya korlensis TaxID=519977 RepID=UPI00082646C4|nr:hypothetical protein [Robertmurraya korlensis]